MNYINVAIDGPAGAGKSTIAKKLAHNLDYIYIDTGAMYRAVTLNALENDIDLDDQNQYQFLNDIDIELTTDDRVIVNKQDVTDQIRQHNVSNNVSRVAALKNVRKKLVEMQRKIATSNHVIMDGRDIGSHVLPKADVKIYLTASVQVRANRRYQDNLERGIETDFKQLQEEIKRRDLLDSTRDLNPLIKAFDAVEIDTSDLTINEVVSKISDIILRKVDSRWILN